MQMKIGKFFRQLAVLIHRTFTLIVNDRVTLASLILQAPVMVCIFKLVGEPECFTANLINVGSRTILFVLCAVSCFMGILNSYREICKEREIIFREASVGVSVTAVVLSKFIALTVIAAMQSLVLTAGFCFIIHVPQNRLVFDTSMEICVTVFLMLVSTTAMGLLISAALKSSETAVLPVLFLLIAQFVFSNCLFKLSGPAQYISDVVVCRWGIGALGASTDLNSRMNWLNLGSDMYEPSVLNLMHCWQMMLLLTGVCLLAAVLVLNNAFRRRSA